MQRLDHSEHKKENEDQRPHVHDVGKLGVPIHQAPAFQRWSDLLEEAVIGDPRQLFDIAGEPTLGIVLDVLRCLPKKAFISLRTDVIVTPVMSKNSSNSHAYAVPELTNSFQSGWVATHRFTPPLLGRGVYSPKTTALRIPHGTSTARNARVKTELRRIVRPSTLGAWQRI